MNHIAHVALLVSDYDTAIDFFIGVLGFELSEDQPLSETKRWVIVKPQGNADFGLLLAKAANEEQSNCIGKQAGGRVFLFLRTDDFWEEYQRLKNLNVAFCREPQSEPYGWVAVFEDPFGNLWDLIGDQL